ncbi:MAG TPA: BTAD domain-containing putative transcriptional regulator [Ktedonobacteraceae bacterium]|nr:BTAD domain-containing putative transcriptional regulator [Ktedonobacteraceae bacterium]
MIPSLHIHLLGDFLLLSEDTPVLSINSPRLQSLLAYLVLHRTAPQDRSHLAFLLWPDSTEARAHSSLRKLLHQLRQALPDIDHFLYTGRQTLYWQPGIDVSWTLDVQDFEQALARAELAEQSQDIPSMRHALEQATNLYRGDLLPSCYDEWMLSERDRLRQLFLSAAERLLALLEEERDYKAAISVAQQLLRQDPLHEATYRQLMRLYALRGDRAAALRIYHTCAQLLERELGTEPGEMTRTLYESLLESDTSLKTPTGPLVSRGTESPLLGRKAEWRQLQEAWRKATRGFPHIVILSGEAGIGKTRLAEEMEAWASRQGITTASGRCYAAAGQLAYAPVTSWLRTDAIQSSLSTLDTAWLTEIARLVPEVLAKHPKLARPATMTEGWQRQHFFEALARALLKARQPLLLLLDDLQWCDNETLEWLHYLLRFDVSARLLIIGTVRAGEILPGHPLQAFLGALQRDGMVTEIALGPLATTETTSLAEHILGHQLAPDMINMLYAETEGNPLFVVEMARAGTLGQHEREQSSVKSSLTLLTQSASMLPPTVQNVLATRLAQLSTLAREVANVAAVIGREFTFDVLARACGESEGAMVQGLDELWQRRIVREQGPGVAQAYDFSHDKLRKQAYDSLSSAHRRLLHRRVAESLEAVYEEELDSVSGQIAAHYEHAGLSERAIPYYRRAGEVALSIYANAEAIAAFERAASLLEAGTPGITWRKKHWEVAAQVYKSLGEIFAITGRQSDARHAYQHAMDWIPAHAYIWQARLLRKTAITWKLASDNPLDTLHTNARQIFLEAEYVLDQAEDKSSRDWIQEWIDLQIDQLLPLRGSVDEMTAIIEKAQDIVEQHGTAEQRGRFFQAVIARDSKRNRYMASEQSLAYRRKGLATVLETGNKDLIGFGHFVLANGLLFSNQLEEAEEQMRMAMKLAEEIGSTPLLVRCLTFLLVILRRRGNVEEVRRVITRALTIPEAQNIAIIKGHRAWLAWHDDNLTEAETYGRASLENPQGRQPINSFQWVGIWPLLGVALTQEKLPDAMDYVRLLLDPMQQPPSEELRTLLESALKAWDAGQQEEARVLLQEVVPLAEKMGYL